MKMYKELGDIRVGIKIFNAYLIKLFERNYRNGKEAILKMTVAHGFPRLLKKC